MRFNFLQGTVFLFLGLSLGSATATCAQTQAQGNLSAAAAVGPLRVSGTVLAVFPDQAEAMVKVTTITQSGGKPISLNPPRVKRLIFGNATGLPPEFMQGVPFVAEGKDLGRGRPLRVARYATNQNGESEGAAREVQFSRPNVRNETSAVATTVPTPRPPRPSLPPLPEQWLLEGFDGGVYHGWRLQGDCWGHGPEYISGRSRVTGARGRCFLSTAHPRLGDLKPGSGTGIALSPEFPLTHTHMRFLIGGGNYPEECCLNLLVEGSVVRTATGDGTDNLSPVEWDIAEFTGKRAQLQILDQRVLGPRAYLLLDQIELFGLPPAPPAEADVEPSGPIVSEAATELPEPPHATLPLAPADAPVANDTTAPSRAFVILNDGTRVEGTHLMTLEATGYGPGENGQWGDRTALGTRVGYGTVAVDPRVIPLRKHLWVEGYGFCIALDTGGAIKGRRIDLGHDTDEEAAQVGRKHLRVLVLD